MYLEYFGLQEFPFSLAPDPRFLYLSGQHREALAHLLYGVVSEGGFVQVTGEVGTGKTTVCRCFLERLPEGTEAAVILNPRLSGEDLVAAICDEFRIPPAPGPATVKASLDRLNAHLLDVHARGRRAVLVVDEAQNLDPEALELVRLLTNLETSRHKLLQIVLIGQPELRATLARPELRQLAQRITARFHLGTLSREETAAYVAHRLGVAGCREPLFPPATIGLLRRLSGGVPRLINIIADRGLLGAFAEGRRRVDGATLRRAAREVSGEGGGGRARALGRASAVAAIVAGATLLVLSFAGRAPLDRPASPAPTRPSVGREPQPAGPVDPAPTAIPTVAPAPEPVPRPVPKPVSKPAPKPSPALAPPPAPAPAPASTSKPTPAAVSDVSAPPPLKPQVEETSPSAAARPRPLPEAAATVSSAAADPDPVVPASPPPPAAAPAALDAILQLDEARDEGEALRRLFALSGVAAAPASIEQACERARSAGLGCLSGAGPWEELLSLDRPGVVHLRDGAGSAWLLLEGQRDGQVALAAGGARTVVDAVRLAGHGVEGYVLVWSAASAAGAPQGENLVVHP